MSTQKPLFQVSGMMLFCQQYAIMRWREDLNIGQLFKGIIITIIIIIIMIIIIIITTIIMI